MNISGSIALVTGGASGLGLATTVRLHEAGASVVISTCPARTAWRWRTTWARGSRSRPAT